jgi:hypothetical protein
LAKKWGKNVQPSIDHPTLLNTSKKIRSIFLSLNRFEIHLRPPSGSCQDLETITLPKSYLGKASGADDLLAHVALLAPGEEAELGAHAEEAHPPLPHALLHVPVQRQALKRKINKFEVS